MTMMTVEMEHDAGELPLGLQLLPLTPRVRASVQGAPTTAILCKHTRSKRQQTTIPMQRMVTILPRSTKIPGR